MLLVPGVLYAAPGHERGHSASGRAAARLQQMKLSAEPRRVRVGEPVRIALAAPGTQPATYRWVITSDAKTASFATVRPFTTWRFGRGGDVTVRVTLLERQRAAAFATLRLAVQGRGGRVARHESPVAIAHGPARAAASVGEAAARPAPVQLAAAAAHAVTIKDFSFGPGSLTIQTGDTVTWTNDGPSQHTATAKDGSFNTGVISKGQSASHTFTSAGTFSYICSIHSFMHGTIVVQGSGSSSGGGSSPSGSGSSSSGGSSSGSTSPASSGSQSGGSSSLPMTGLDVLALASAGGVLLAAGGALRRRARNAFGAPR